MGLFTGLVFFIIGTFSKKQEEVKTILINNGATIAKSITQSNTTHVLKGNTKKSPWTEINSQRELNNQLYVIPYDWIQACLNSSTRVDESEFDEGNLDDNDVAAKEEEVEEEVEEEQRVPFASTSKGKGKRVRSPSPVIVAEPKNIIKILKKGNWPVDHRMRNNHLYKLIPYTDKIPYDAMLNLTNISNNNNKFYGIQVLQSEEKEDSFFTINVWGRVGDAGQIKIIPYSNLELALKEFHRKFEDKTKLTWETRNDTPVVGKYTFLERSYDDDEKVDEEEEESTMDNNGEGSNGSPKKFRVEDKSEVVSKLKIEVQNLMKFIFNLSSIQQTLSSFEYDANKLPLGKLSKSSLELGFTTLKQIESILNNPKLAKNIYNFTSVQKSFIELTNRYYTLIPHSFGRSKPPVISTDLILQKELSILSALGEIKITEEIIKEAGSNNNQKGGGEILHSLDSQFQQLGLKKFEVIDPSSDQFEVLENLLVNTKGPTHNDWDLKLIDAFEVEREEETTRWNSSNYSSPSSGTKKLLFHGSRSSNFGGILSHGLRIPSDTTPGLIFGKGIYLTPISSKAAMYCFHGVSDNEGLLLLCEAQCGVEPLFRLEKPEYEAESLAKEAGFSTTWGMGRIQPSTYEDASILSEDLIGVQMPSSKLPPREIEGSSSSLLYDEFVFYNVDRVRIKYLLRVRFNEVD